MYIDNQSAVPCKKGDFELPAVLDGMKEYIEAGKIKDFQDHHYPSEMAICGYEYNHLYFWFTDRT